MIRFAQFKHDGVYECIATTTVTSLSASGKLTVQGMYHKMFDTQNQYALFLFFLKLMYFKLKTKIYQADLKREQFYTFNKLASKLDSV